MDIVPVKNEEGIVIMFILDFQELIDPSLKKSGLRQRVTQGWIYCKAFDKFAFIASVTYVNLFV